jgi:hypothetical protein
MTPGSAAAWIEKQTVACGLRPLDKGDSEGFRDDMAQKTPVGIETRLKPDRTLVTAPGW